MNRTSNVCSNVLGLIALLAALLSYSGPSAAGYSFDNTNTASNSVWCCFGPNTHPFVGETFSLPSADTALNNFSLSLAYAGGNFSVQGYIGAWDGMKVTNVLYSSSQQYVPITGNGGAWSAQTEFTFDTGSLPLAAGQQYVAYLQLIGAASVSAAMPIGTSYSGGYAVTTAAVGSFNYGGSIGLCTYGVLTCWSNNSNVYGMGGTDGDLFLKLNSSPAVAAVPEPESYAMMLAGLGLLGFMARRKKKPKAA